MSDWLHDLPIVWMGVFVFGCIYLLAVAIYAAVMGLAADDRGRSFKAVSPGLLPPLGIMFALFVAFTASQVWNDNQLAQTAVNREASALRAIAVMSASYSADTEAHFRDLIRGYIEETTTKEWPLLAQGSITLSLTPPALADALRVTLALTPNSEGQKAAQREIITAIENALDARRQRILISQSQVNLVKWLSLLLLAICALVAIAMVHSDNRLASAISMTLFATGVAASVLIILSHDRPFTGDVAVGPRPLLQEIAPNPAPATGTVAKP